MFPTLIQRYDKNHFIFDPVQKRETNRNFMGFQMLHFMTLSILYINLLNISWIKKISTFEEYGAFMKMVSIEINKGSESIFALEE